MSIATWACRMIGNALMMAGRKLLDVWIAEDIKAKDEQRGFIHEVIKEHRQYFCTCSRQFEPWTDPSMACSCQTTKRGLCCCHQINDAPIGKG